MICLCHSAKHILFCLEFIQMLTSFIYQPLPMCWQLIGMVSLRRFQNWSTHMIWLALQEILQ